MSNENPWGYRTKGDKLLAILAVGCLSFMGVILFVGGFLHEIYVLSIFGVIFLVPTICLLPGKWAQKLFDYWNSSYGS